MGTKYGSMYYESAANTSAGITFLLFALAITVAIAFALSINLFINAAKEKGHYKDGGTGLLWFIGIFASPIVVGLYTSSLPDLRDKESKREEALEDELPAV